MKNNNLDYKKIINHFLDFKGKSLSEIVKEIYKQLVSKLRFSIVLRLNLIYIVKLINTFFLLNIVFVGILGYYFFYSADMKNQSNFNTISTIVEGKSELPTYNLSVISEIDNTIIRVYDEDNNLKYSSISEEIGEGKEKYDSKKLRVGNNRYIQPVIETVVNNEENSQITSEASTEGIKSFNFILRKELATDFATLNLEVSSNIYNDFKYIMILIMVLICIEAIIILLFIPKGAKRIRRTLKPIDVMNDTVKNITINHLDTRLNIGGSQNELKDLAITFNNMLDRIQQSYEAQNQFVSDASHELRTPIAVLQGYVKMLDRWGKKDEKVLDESIEALKSESENMKSLVEKLLFLARGDKNTQQVNKDNFSLNELIDEVYKETKMIDNKHEIVLLGNESINIFADRNLLKESLRIFIDNSIKYTPEGGVITLASYSNGNKANIIVQDTGIGISKEDLPKVFDRFYRADKSRTRETGGTGLGLTIAKWIIMKHQGDIALESKLNEGTKIIIKIPI